jgi:hypothetical protein
VEPVDAATDDEEMQRPEEEPSDGDIAFVMGDFGSADVEDDEDYLGLKSLGVGVLGKIPEKLWNVDKERSKLQPKRRKSTVAKSWKNTLLARAAIMKQVVEYPPPPAFQPIQRADQVIGLLKPFFTKKLSESQAGFLVEV